MSTLDVRSVLVLDSMLHTFHYRPLTLGADLLSALKGHEGKLKVMRSLLQ